MDMKKQEYEERLKEYKDLMKEILEALNQIKNTKVDTKNFRDTYSICTKLGKMINK